MKTTLGVCALAALGFAAAAGAQPPPDCGCSAPSSGSAVGDLARYQSAFAGRVTAVDDGRATFEVLRVYKGQRGKTLAVAPGAAACGFAFETGKAYLVYAKGDKQGLSTDRCAPNRPLAEAQAQLRQLDLHTGQSASPLRVP